MFETTNQMMNFGQIIFDNVNHLTDLTVKRCFQRPSLDLIDVPSVQDFGEFGTTIQSVYTILYIIYHCYSLQPNHMKSYEII
jgi:hypothetical protein